MANVKPVAGAAARGALASAPMRKACSSLVLVLLIASLPMMAAAWPEQAAPQSYPQSIDTKAPLALACQNLSVPPLNANVRWAEDVFPVLENCAACHLSEFQGSRIRIYPGNPELTLIDVLDPATDLIRALRPRTSALFKRVNCDETTQQEWRMPRCFVPPCNYWTPATQALLFDWIAQGARGEFDGSPQSDIIMLDALEGARIDVP